VRFSGCNEGKKYTVGKLLAIGKWHGTETHSYRKEHQKQNQAGP